MKTPPISKWMRFATTLIALSLAMPDLIPGDEPAPKPIKGLLLIGSGLNGGKFQIDPVLAGKLAAKGISFDAQSINEPLDAATLHHYPVVMIAGWSGSRLSAFVPRRFMEEYLTAKANVGVIKDYVEKGGGLFIIPQGDGVPGSRTSTEFYSLFGAGQDATQVRDDQHAFVTTYPDHGPDEYAWTTEVIPHPVTKGVSRIYYPTTQFRWDDMYSTPVLTFSDPAWKPVVKGMDTSVGAKGFDYTTWRPESKQPTLAAVRDFSAGRIAFFAPNYYYLLSKPYDDPKNGWFFEAHTGKIGGVVVEKGDGTHPSDGLTLMTNMIRWLADNALAKGFEPGTETMAPTEAKPVPAPDWIYSWNPSNGSKWFKVLVGARSKFSDGEGTIEDYAKAAKAAGIDVLVMTETFEKFDVTKWAAYREACQKASDDTIKVIAGIDIEDTYQARYIIMNSPICPWPGILSTDGKMLAKDQYLCLGFPEGTTILHRPSNSALLNELQKDFQGVSIYTYKNGKLEDNGLPAYEWQVFALSNPLPFVVHETYSPQDLAMEASTGHQLYVSADNLGDANLYLAQQGLTHFWEAPLHLQVSSGPIITRLENSAALTIEDDVPITDVRLMENYNLYRHWTPNATKFSVDQIKLPDGHVNWVYLVATDAKGRTVVSPGMNFGKQIVHTWRCGDRQNWWCFPNIYTGTEANQFMIQVPAFGTEEGHDLFPEVHGPLRGDNMTSILQFVYEGPAVYIQDVDLDERYYRALHEDVAYDAKPVAGAVRSRVYAAKIRYLDFYLEPHTGAAGTKSDYLPYLKDVTIETRRPLDPVGEIFPVFTRLDAKHAQVAGDMSYSYLDPKTGSETTGKLTAGTLDLPAGGHVGGLIALTGGIRVGADGKVGFASPEQTNGALPTGTKWNAAFVTVDPAQVDKWRALFGLTATTPYKVTVSKGTLKSLAYVATCLSDSYLLSGNVDTALPKEFLDGLFAGEVDRNNEAKGRALDEYKLPVSVNGLQYNWPAFLWRDDGTFEPVDVFEGNGWARLDVTTAGAFHIGNVVLADDLHLKIGLLKWTPDLCTVEVNNPTDKPIKTRVFTTDALTTRLKAEWDVDLAPGTSTILTKTK
jgi:hypothetical protein